MKEKTKRVYKLSAVLMVLCLITACVIGTTLAKYTTGGSAEDSASVAKWGVKVQIQGDGLFSNEYTGTGDAVTVSSSGTSKLVAAGTSGGGASSSLKFAIEGTPQVSVKVDVSLTDVKDVYLKAGTHTDPITGETVNVTADYYPIVFKLVQTKDEHGDKTNTDGSACVIAQGTLAQIKTALDTYTTTATYAPNTNLTAEFELSWTWAFEKGHDDYDTLLGNYAASTSVTASDTGSINVGYDLTVTVTQVD